MAQVSILKGIYTNNASDFRTSYPRNLVPVPLDNGISGGYLRPAEGLIKFAVGPGPDRGGINWNGVCYRVMGTKLVSISSNGTVTALGDVGSGGQCSFDYSFDRLAIASGGRLYYYRLDGSGLVLVTDQDLGAVIDMLWVDGYFLTTDGTSLVVTELNDPTAVNPLKYGSSEVDPDPVLGVLKLRDEVYAFNRYTVEAFQNVGGDANAFPFQRIDGAMLERGSIGTHCATVFLDSITFLGGGRNESPAIWMGANGSTVNISTREIDLILKEYPENVLATSVMESRVVSGQKLLYLHLPDQTLVYDAAASEIVEAATWHILTSTIVDKGLYRARSFIYCYDKWIAGDPASGNVSYLSSDISTHLGETIGWECSTAIMYKGGKGAVFSELELVCLTGRTALGVNPTIWTSYSVDGRTWSQEKYRTLGKIGQTLKRINWYNQGFMRHWRIQKFRGTSDSHLTLASLEVRMEPLNG